MRYKAKATASEVSYCAAANRKSPQERVARTAKIERGETTHKKKRCSTEKWFWNVNKGVFVDTEIVNPVDYGNTVKINMGTRINESMGVRLTWVVAIRAPAHAASNNEAGWWWWEEQRRGGAAGSK